MPKLPSKASVHFTMKTTILTKSYLTYLSYVREAPLKEQFWNSKVTEIEKKEKIKVRNSPMESLILSDLPLILRHNHPLPNLLVEEFYKQTMAPPGVWIGRIPFSLSEAKVLTKILLHTLNWVLWKGEGYGLWVKGREDSRIWQQGWLSCDTGPMTTSTNDDNPTEKLWSKKTTFNVWPALSGLKRPGIYINLSSVIWCGLLS